MAGRDKKILSIHSRKAEEDVLEILSQCNVKNFILHWYTGDFAALTCFLNQGAYFSINSEMFKSKRILKFLELVPKDRILVETDAPYTLKQQEEYINAVDKIYSLLQKNGISSELIFNNFKTLLLNI